MLTYILWGIFLYFIYRFVVGFVLPVWRTTSQVKKQFNAMREQMEGQQAGPQQTYEKANSGRTYVNNTDQKPKYDIEGEYIPFEENPK